MHIRSKLPNVGTTIFAKMTALANEHGAINLAQGFPDFPSSERLIDLVHHYMKKGMNQYAPMPGLLSLREGIAEKISELYQYHYNPETEITITAGATQAIYTILSACIHPGDEVIVFEPAYDSYVPGIRMAGGVPVYIELHAPDYKIEWEQVKQKISEKTKMIMINSPHNPSGTILSADDLQELERITAGTDICIISDEVYEHIIFDERRHESVLHYPALAERSFVVFSFGKTYHNTGWKIGYILAPQQLTKEVRNVHQFLVFSVNTPIQYALADFIRMRDEYLSVQAFYQQKRNLFLELMKSSAFVFTPANGTYFQLLDYSKISDKNDIEFADALTINHKVASIPLSPFYRAGTTDKMLRFCFAKKDETLAKAAEILCMI
ncbi:MAG: methionine aminotransferase [Chitinophagales bacterium]|nr:methionine aminotransferase [Chitinophagales bacterium]